MASNKGIVVFDFGSIPGTNLVQTVVSNPTISSTSVVEIYMMGTDSTASHNTIEHQLIPVEGISLQCVSITAGVGFTAQVISKLRLTGLLQARFVWTD